MKYKPHKYQEYASKYIEDHEIAAIFLDLGLGKTVISLTAINNLLFDSFEVSKVLIIAPLRVARDTWKDEIEKWDHLSLLEYSVVVGSQKEREKALEKKADIYIINRENVVWLIENYAFNYDMVVIDELTSFKSHRAKRFKALIKVRPKVKRMVGLTGTPSSNGLMDLWAQFRLLDMGDRLGKFISYYREVYFKPDKRNGHIIYSYKPLPDSEEKIYQKIADITVSMKAKDFIEMPEKIISDVKVKMSPKEKELYDDFKKEMVLELKNEEIDAVNAAVLSNKLLQLASGAIYTKDKDYVVLHEKKLDALEDLIEAANGKPVLIVYNFKHDLERIKKRFDVRELRTSEAFKRWNEGEIPLAMIHPQSAGHGLNLQHGGSTIIWFSLTWSLEFYEQTNARLFRQGQKDTVVIHHILCEETIDEDVVMALKNKSKIQEALLKAVKANMEVG
ncbi:DEAD/DEAH box helicase [Allofustis seminis]|uniref:DEAD/DEAH box helicase n=1 Tax=Allofustis seminis TaxID=166939 RepID=UPI00036DB996|nr:DEAD/DEAH box helicase [Allofustis seminis]